MMAIGAASPEGAVRHVALPYLLDLHRAVGHTIHLCVLRGPEVVYVEKLYTPRARLALPPLLAELTVPTLLVHGRDDRAVHFENALRLMAMIPSARLYLINNCGHWAQREHAEEFNRVVHEFISAH
jgi:pimeloyl-ACP methyl ester carboxylesterase